MIRKLLALLLCSILLYSCETPDTKKLTSSELPFLFKNEILLLDSIKPMIVKSVGDSDIVKTNEINWNNELSFFTTFETEFQRNKLDYTPNNYTLNDVNKAYEFDVAEYTATNNKLQVQKATYYFKNKTCKKIVFHRNTGAMLLSNVQVLVYEPSVGYAVHGEQSIRGINKLNYKLNAKFISPNPWRGILQLNEQELPFNFTFDNNKMVIHNAEERIIVDKIRRVGDSIFCVLPFFNSEIKALITGESIIGNWHNYDKGDDYIVSFNAYKNNYRFDYDEKASSLKINGKWEVIFSPSTKGQYPAIGVFKQDGNYLTGTFITETGDYRYLEGCIEGNKLNLSCFDGAHAFLFTGEIDEQDRINGVFYSGIHWSEPWVGVRNEQATLRDPYSLTELNTIDSILNFSFLNLDSVMVSLTDEKYKNKAIIVQIMGSWCPNCMDETNLFKEFYSKYNQEGLEVIAVCLERSDNFSKNKLTVQKIKSDLKVPYEMLLAGKASKENVAVALPMLQHIASYPTSLYLDRNKKVQRIHTGFYGPGTGRYNENFVKEMDEFIRDLLN